MNSGGLTPEERQRQTAAEIARKKVVAAYSQSGEKLGFSVPESAFTNTERKPDLMRTETSVQPVSRSPLNQVPNQIPPVQQNTYKYTEPNASRSQDWQAYHTAWQNYYQKYYAEYYSQAAQTYVEKEKKKAEDEFAKQRIAYQTAMKVEARKEKERKERQKAAAINLAENINSAYVEPEQAERIADKLKETVQKKAASKFSVKKKHRKMIPIMIGVTVMLVILFLQYNRLIFAPIIAYVSPGNVSDEEIAAIDPNVTNTPVGEDKLIIPKLNIDVPAFFGIGNDTPSLNKAMENGVAHFRIPGASAMPGEVGNVVISGHSAGDLYSSVQYKFIFSGIERLVEGDLIYINYDHKRYTYKVNAHRRTVDPKDVASLKYDGDKAILTLLTCWPVGTAKYRLLVEAEQINPVIAETEKPAEVAEVKEPEEEMPKNEKTFFENVWSFLTGN